MSEWKERRFGPRQADEVMFFFRLLEMRCFKLAGLGGEPRMMRRFDDPVTAEIVFQWLPRKK